MKEARNTREIIEAEYPEFPETILHAELCRACARVDGRSIQSLKAFALERIEKVESKPLKGALEQMASSMFPETEIARIRACVGRMESALVKTFGVKRA
ncbi:hypothetical protein FDX19_21010 [Citrobacter sp. wls619]|uniref:hypothetical protein n=1 Tax=Citrobacter sp. wls619 TaxID=2576432 RepID=UPI0010CA1508|nr:hypothetical protein [Citrobacter sp. wls619]TKV06452.1 hypothetical protein FDX19_21010 [Citrobacter sp. wls619]